MRKWFENYGPVDSVKVGAGRPALRAATRGAAPAADAGACCSFALGAHPALTHPPLPPHPHPHPTPIARPLFQLIYDKETGQSRGFGFVTFDDDRDALDALNDAGGRDLDGAAIKVNTARGPGGFVASGYGRGRGRCEGGQGGRAAAPSGGAAPPCLTAASGSRRPSAAPLYTDTANGQPLGAAAASPRSTYSPCRGAVEPHPLTTYAAYAMRSPRHGSRWWAHCCPIFFYAHCQAHSTLLRPLNDAAGNGPID